MIERGGYRRSSERERMPSHNDLLSRQCTDSECYIDVRTSRDLRQRVFDRSCEPAKSPANPVGMSDGADAIRMVILCCQYSTLECHIEHTSPNIDYDSLDRRATYAPTPNYAFSDRHMEDSLQQDSTIPRLSLSNGNKPVRESVY
jgi:hypothetical protein